MFVSDYNGICNAIIMRLFFAYVAGAFRLTRYVGLYVVNQEFSIDYRINLKLICILFCYIIILIRYTAETPQGTGHDMTL